MADDSDYGKWKAAQKNEVSSRGNIRDYLRSIDGSLRTIKRIALWWLILSILGVIGAILYILNRF